MRTNKLLLLTATHVAAIAMGFAIGIYTLPILIAPEAPSADAIKTMAVDAQYTGEFRRDLKGSDLLHWGRGKVYVGPKAIAFMGELAPGPDYKLYLVPEFVETEADFLRIKTHALRVGDVKTFKNFIVTLPASVDLTQYNTVVVWCESFSQFITAAKYR